jgi:hypothetical protein
MSFPHSRDINSVVWEVTPYSPVDVYCSLGRIHFPRNHGGEVRQATENIVSVLCLLCAVLSLVWYLSLKIESLRPFEISADFYKNNRCHVQEKSKGNAIPLAGREGR